MITSTVLGSSAVIKLFDLLLYTSLKYHFLMDRKDRNAACKYLCGIEANGLNCYIGNLLSLHIQQKLHE